jgi:hypothetical protein
MFLNQNQKTSKMGLNNNQSAGVFLQVSKGKLVRQFSNPTEKSVVRVNKNGKTVHEEFYDSLTARLQDIKVKDSDFGKFWTLTFNDGQTNYFIDLNYSGGYAISFLKTLPNADLTIDMTIVPKYTEEGDKKSSVIFINQNGKGLKHFWTRDNPKDLPDLKKIKVKGKDTWDDSDRLDYLLDYVNQNILPQLGGKPSSKAVSTPDDDMDTPF